MTISETKLLAYVDGELSPADIAEIDRLLETNEELRLQELALRASCLPYQEAFSSQRLPDVPAELRERVQSLISSDDRSELAPVTRSKRWPLIGAALAASFAAGLWMPVPIRLDPQEHENLPWVHVIAHYQSLYVRETAERVMDDTQVHALLARFTADGGMSVAIPDLRSAGYTFGRIQRLAVGNVPMIQTEYLPANGKPISLCVLAVRRDDAKVSTRRIDGFGVSTWRRNGLEFVMLTDMPEKEVNRLALLVSRGDLPVLYESESHGS